MTFFPRSVKPVYNDHSWDPKILPLLTSGCCSEDSLFSKSGKYDSKKWSLKTGGRYSEVVVSSGLTAFTLKMIGHKRNDNIFSLYN